MAKQVAMGFPTEMFEQKKKDLQMEKIELTKAEIQANPEIPEWRKTMIIKQLELNKKKMGISSKEAELQNMEMAKGEG